jgi:hypothetical protein
MFERKNNKYSSTYSFVFQKSFTFCSKFDIIEKEKGKQFGGGIK